MSDAFTNGIYLAFGFGFALFFILLGLAWIVNLARHMFIGDD